MKPVYCSDKGKGIYLVYFIPALDLYFQQHTDWVALKILGKGCYCCCMVFTGYFMFGNLSKPFSSSLIYSFFFFCLVKLWPCFWCQQVPQSTVLHLARLTCINISNQDSKQAPDHPLIDRRGNPDTVQIIDALLRQGFVFPEKLKMANICPLILQRLIE